MEEPSNFSNRGINVFFFFLSLERNILRDDGGFWFQLGFCEYLWILMNFNLKQIYILTLKY